MLGNFESAFALFLALHSFPVDRLKNTRALVNKNSLKNFDELSKLFSMERNNQRYKTRLQHTVPAIPIVSAFTKELFMIDEGNTSGIISS